MSVDSPQRPHLVHGLLVGAVLAGVACSAERPESPADFDVRSEPPGYQMISTTGPDGRVTVMLPADVRAGDIVTGRLSVSNADDTGQVPAGPGRRSSALTLHVAGTPFPLTDHRLQLSVGSEATALPLVLRDASGSPLAEGSLTLAPPAAGSRAGDRPTHAPPYCSAHGLVVVGGAFDGDSRTTLVRIGRTELDVWTESPRQLIAVASGLPPGPHDMRVEDPNVTYAGRVNVLGVEITPRRVEATPGASVPYEVIIDGLEAMGDQLRPVLGLHLWSEDAETDAEQRRYPLRPTDAVEGRIVVSGEAVAPASGTFWINGGVLPALGPR